MFRGSSTRKEKKSKKTPNLGDSQADVALIKSIGLDQVTFKMVLKPQDKLDFFTESNHQEGSDTLVLDVSSNPSFSQTISQTNETYIYIVLDRLTVKQLPTTEILKFEFLPLQGTGSQNPNYTVRKVEFIYSNNNDRKTFDITSHYIKLTQIINMDPNSTLIEPVEWNDDLEHIVPEIRLYNSTPVILTNFINTNSTENIRTNLVLKGDITKIYDKLGKYKISTEPKMRALPIQIPLQATAYYISYINDIVDTRIPISENSEETIKIGINTSGSRSTEFVFAGIELTEEQKQSDWWKDFYINKIIRFEDQVFDFTFKGYSEAILKSAVDQVATMAPIDKFEVDGTTLKIYFTKQDQPEFLGPPDPNTQRLHLWSPTSTGYEQKEYERLDLILEELECNIVLDVDFSSIISIFFNLINSGSPYMKIILHVRMNNQWTENAMPNGYSYPDPIISQTIQTLRLYNGEIIKKEVNGKIVKLLVPTKVQNIYNSDKNKLELNTVSAEGSNGLKLSIETIKTINLLNRVTNELSLVVQGKIPIEWYKWLPLNNVYIDRAGTVYVNPESTNNLIKLVSINAIPSEDVGIDTSNPSELDLSGIDLETGEPLENN